MQPGGALAASKAGIEGQLSATRAAALTLCESTVGGRVIVQGTSGYALIGSAPGDTESCPGNTINGPLTLDANSGGIEASANTVSGAGRVTGNSGSGLLPEDAVPESKVNKIGGPLDCTGNNPTLEQSGNTVTGPRSGQCR